MENKELQTTEVAEVKEESKIQASRFEVEQQLNQFVGNLKVEGMTPKAKLALVKLKIELGKITEDINDFRKKAVESIEKPENYDEYKEAAEKEDATDETKAAFKVLEDAYNKKFSEMAIPYFNHIVSIPFDFISPSDFYTMVEHNDINVIFGYEYIYNKLVKE